MKKFKIYISESKNIYENLAFEEFLVTERIEDVLLFYINEDSVVIGKHQNPWKEVNLNSAKQNDINIARRLSGGGTVYHDNGNINFSYIRNKDGDFVNFKEHINPISQALKNLGIDNEISSRNDIFIGSYKISGNAEHVNNLKKRIIHHGTLLYNSNIKKLSNNIRPKELNIKTHAVDSVRSPVKNISKIKDLGMTEDFLDKLVKQLQNLLEISEIELINPNKIIGVIDLVNSKYKSWEWIFGYTPQFVFTNSNGTTFKIRKGFVIESSDKNSIGVRADNVIL